MTQTGAFTIEISQQDEWPCGTTEIAALIAVTARPDEYPDDVPFSAGAAEVIILDCSGSMANPLAKLRAAKRAARAALEVMRDGTEFAVVAGTTRGQVAYPRQASLTRATPQTRAEAIRAIDQLDAAGGTMISSWLVKARDLLAPYPGHVRHAMLFTDGKNQDERQDGTLGRVLGTCRGVFTCDARGIGDEWEPQDLRTIVSALHGRADGLPDAAGLVDDFRAVMGEAMRKAVPDVALRLRTAPGAAVRELRQMFPTDADITGQRVPVDGAAADYWTGSWSGETRDYVIKMTVDPGVITIGQEVRLARVEAVSRHGDGTVILAGPGFIVARWTDDPPEVTQFPSDIYDIQRRAGDAIVAGCHRWQDDEFAAAEAAWGRAAQLARRAGDTERLRVLNSLVEVLDAAAGQVRIRDDLTRAVVMQAELRATNSTQVSGPAPPHIPSGPARNTPAPVAGPGMRCAGCGRVSPPGARYCEQCRKPLDGTPPDQAGSGR